MAIMRFFRFDTIKGIFKKQENLLLLLSSFIAIVSSILFVYRGSMPTPPLWLSLSLVYFLFILSVFIFGIALVFIVKNPVNFPLIAKKILWTYLPAEAILIFGFLSYNRLYYFPFNTVILALINFYIAFLGFFLFLKIQNYQKISDFFRSFRKTETSPAGKKYRKIAIGFFLSVIVLVNLAFGSYHLSEFAAVDEPLWTFGRIPKFWNNVQDGEFYKTMVSDKPGITVAIISGIGLNWVNPAEYKIDTGQDKVDVTIPGLKKMNFALRFPILLFNALMLFIFYFALKKLLGETTAILSVILIALSPLLLGISTIINPDSLLWTLAPLSLLYYLIYLKNYEKKYLYISGFFLGLAVLTKYIANIFYIFYFGLIFLEYAINKEKYKNLEISSYFRKAFIDYFSLIIISLLTFFIFLPAAWVNVARLAEGTLLSKAFITIWPVFLGIIALVLIDVFALKNKIFSSIMNFFARYRIVLLVGVNILFLLLIILTFTNTYSGMKFYDFESLLASPKSAYTTGQYLGIMLANVFSLVFGINPLAIVAIIALLIINVWRSVRKKINVTEDVSLYLILFIILYYLASTFENVSATVRYQIIIYPLALILSAMGIYEVVMFPKIKKYFIPVFSYFILLIISLYSLNHIRPFYFSYASDLLPSKYVLNLKDMGDGSYEAAQYLNNLPDARNLVIWSDKRGVCYFSVARCETGFDFDKEGTIFDYYVVSSGRESRTSKMTVARVNGGNATLFRLDKLYDVENPEYQIKIDDRPNNFIKIVNAADLK